MQNNNKIKQNAVIFDYGFGNVRSVWRAFEHIGVKCEITNDFTSSINTDLLIIPGVGSFGECMNGLLAKRGDEIIKHRTLGDLPVLGICVGQQILLQSSDETPEISGLGIIKAKNERIKAKVVPHMGWNTIDNCKDFPIMQEFVGNDFYFVHSYGLLLEEVVNGKSNSLLPSNVQDFSNLAYCSTDYYDHENDLKNGCTIISGIQSKYVTGFQFHPEKSGENGLNLLERWAKTYE